MPVTLDSLQHYTLPTCDFMLQSYSKAADVFSFGMILWELITWQMPWEELGVFQVCSALHLKWPICLAAQELALSSIVSYATKRGAVMHVMRRVSGMVVSGSFLMSPNWAKEGREWIADALAMHAPGVSMRGAAQIMVSVAEKNQRPDIPAEPEKLPGGTFGGWDAYVALIQRCWAGELGERPAFEPIINVLRELLTESASQTRQRRMTDPSSPGTEGIGSPSGLPPKLAVDSTSPGEPHQGPMSVLLVDPNICGLTSPLTSPPCYILAVQQFQIHSITQFHNSLVTYP